MTTNPIKTLIDLGPELQRLMGAATATPWGNRGKLSDRIVGPDEKTIAEFVSQALGKNGDEQDEANAVFCTFIVNNTQTILAAIEALKRADVVMVDRNTVLEEAAKVHEPSCSCPHPCDDYWIWPSSCHKKAAAVIRALKTAPPASPAPVDDGERVRAAKIEAFDEALSIAEGSYSYGEQQNEIIAGIRAALAAINGEK